MHVSPGCVEASILRSHHCYHERTNANGFACVASAEVSSRERERSKAKEFPLFNASRGMEPTFSGCHQEGRRHPLTSSWMRGPHEILVREAMSFPESLREDK